MVTSGTQHQMIPILKRKVSLLFDFCTRTQSVQR
jgi:hypothetical protein